MDAGPVVGDLQSVSVSADIGRCVMKVKLQLWIIGR